MRDYGAFLARARKYASHAETYWLHLMLLLVNTEEKRDLWVANPHKIRSWPKLVQEEGLCTARHYQDFKQALAMLGLARTTKLGAYAAIRLAKVSDEAKRQSILSKTVAWIRRHRVHPTYQRITEYVRQEARQPRAKPQPKPSSDDVMDLRRVCLRQEATIADLRSKLRWQKTYIRLLCIELRTHNIPVPPPLQSDAP